MDIDHNDKLKPFGFYAWFYATVHGCIDSFNRKIIWLHIVNTNPVIIAYCFIKEVEVINATTTKFRADLALEN